ncbi:L7Ae/L30e/S12e/Gadd45 family ribosomal protein [Neomoorella mulderi]|uniref:Putative ribosomal protein YlxQ n=1 Tax=Moorella mulderi DSM 14980 TaxID=1122241 RepID=A0A151AX01_9FIRM|nr:ribosomal L7Ae/L30e/S12e/Gadd45 family protein [Moorella mulderi]KYH32175.1 putative ribosomal protein YlxQ [Moorella mulderi DSM 14980]
MNDVYNLLGLAYRAGKVAWGYQAVMAALKRRKVFLLLMAGDSSPRLKRKLLTTCREYAIEGIVYGDKVTMGAALGKPPCAVVGVTDANLARLIRQHVREVGA